MKRIQNLSIGSVAINIEKFSDRRENIYELLCDMAYNFFDENKEGTLSLNIVNVKELDHLVLLTFDKSVQLYKKLITNCKAKWPFLSRAICKLSYFIMNRVRKILADINLIIHNYITKRKNENARISSTNRIIPDHITNLTNFKTELINRKALMQLVGRQKLNLNFTREFFNVNNTSDLISHINISPG